MRPSADVHVVILSEFAIGSGGAQAVAIRSALGLAALGAAVTLVHATGAAEPSLGAAGVRTVGLGLPDVWSRPALAGAVAGIWNREAARRLGAALDALAPEPMAGRTLPPTILHLHQWTRAFSPSVFPVLLRDSWPLVVTLHDYVTACPNGVYYRFDRGEPCALRPMSIGCLAAPCDPTSRAHKGVRVLRAAATRAAMRGRRFDVVHVSDRGRDTLAPFLPAALAQHRIDNPIDVVRRPLATVAAGGAIAFVGRLTREKGADLVAAAAAAAGRPALFVGEGPAEAEIRRRHPGAEILGWQSRGDVEALLGARALAVAAPSRWYETGPLTVAEAAAAGLPAIVSRRAGAAGGVADGVTGYVVEPEVDAVAAAIRRMVEPGRAATLGQAAYDRYWAAPRDGRAHADALLGLYREILARRT